jgi:hypothetical protein
MFKVPPETLAQSEARRRDDLLLLQVRRDLLSGVDQVLHGFY